MKKEMSEALLYRFVAGQTTEEEADRIALWLDEDPVEHQKTLDRVFKLRMLSHIVPDVPAASSRRGKVRRIGRAGFVRYTAGIAAALLVGLVINYFVFSRRESRIAELATTIEAPAGQHIRFRLNDGSVIDLDSGGSITYPAIFTGDERRVKLSGRAMFDVAPDAKNPFVVETFACEVRVLGTRFDVIADEEDNEFSTALFEGRVAVSNLSAGEEIVMEPETVVNLLGGRLVKSRMEGMDDYLWPEGIISVGGVPFDEVKERLERAFGVRIEVARPTEPVIKYARLKIRVSDGIDYAMGILSLKSDFTYEYDSSENIVTIK